jgi:hypothetical protein
MRSRKSWNLSGAVAALNISAFSISSSHCCGFGNVSLLFF